LDILARLEPPKILASHTKRSCQAGIEGARAVSLRQHISERLDGMNKQACVDADGT